MAIDRFRVGVAREHFGIHTLFAHAPGDQLRILRTKIKDSDTAVSRVGHQPNT
jgi:hypothetical protein